MNDQTIITVGKTKRILTVANQPYKVDIESKDDITAGDGEKKDVIEGKAASATITTCNCFQLLHREGLITHFVNQIDDRTFRAHFMDMIPIELVARRLATGSYLKRRPDVEEGTIFEDLVIEFFFKDDQQHDPLMIVDPIGKRILYYKAKELLASGFLREEPIEGSWSDLLEILPQLVVAIRGAFTFLERAWANQDVVLVDLKIECGRSKRDGIIHIADVIDNDSWRIWPKGDIKQMMDKQVYRNLESATPEELSAIGKNYAWVAEATNKFQVV